MVNTTIGIAASSGLARIATSIFAILSAATIFAVVELSSSRHRFFDEP